ncbi:bifunctional diguanylate cyclase/phosphodiesterase [Undibacterium sp.]|jgi:diguanylate cyclase (GGDEF)-like protein/PAS domain S-box-containing protein|uniref:bifunctional diguanylate cyclase/phosphodiesterase n=1 Tax=Undibacterium sp. TaxID=1914977 RepID=UPI002B7382EA|nr:EAL domain-containing protein [Undibacterium sp.]HTD03098.1 EAL domain-containing protein [Undibacterium sp.]
MERTTASREQRDVPTTVFLSIVSLIIIAILGQTWWSVAQDKVLTLSSAQENSYLAVRVLEEHASRILQDATRSIGAAAEDIKNEGDDILHDEAAMRQILVNQRQDSRFLQSIAVVSTSGNLWATSFQFPAEQIDLNGRQYVKFLLQHPAYKAVLVGAPVKVRQGSRWILPVARNIYNAEGQHAGLIQVEIDLAYLNEFYERVARDGDASISLHDNDGNIIIRSPFDERYLSLNVGRSAIANRIRNGSVEGVLQDKPFVGGDAELMYTYRKMLDFPITVVYARDRGSVLLSWSQRLKQRVFLAALTIGFILLLAGILVWHINHLRKSNTRLKASENRYRLLYLEAQDAILLINRDYCYVDCNPAAVALFGAASAAEIVGRRAGEFSPDAQKVDQRPNTARYKLVAELVDAAFEGAAQRFEWTTHRHGQLQFNEVTLSRVEVENEMLLFCVMRDVNSRKYTERLMEGQNRLLQLIGSREELPNILEAVCQFVEKLNPHWRCGIQLLSDDQRSFSRLAGRNFPEILKPQVHALAVSKGNGVWSEAIINASPVWVEDLQLAPEMQFVNALEQLSDFASCGAWPIMGKNGQLLGTFTLFFTTRARLGDEDMVLMGITTDIASIAIEDRRSEEKILKLAHYDDLTGLPNRFLYHQHLAKSLAHAERNRSRLAVFFVDLDRFKNINDTFGHDEGDTVLRNIARRFKACLRESDTVARVGGDEFILLVDQYDNPMDLSDIAEKLLVEAALPFDIRGQECQLSASIGIATYPADGKDAQTLLKNADIAMYRAKNRGKDNYQFYASEMNVHTVERLAFEARLRRALERREFVVYYQPKLDIASGRIVGAEALVRWNHPERGILFPGEFITLAEEAGLIGRLGMLVLDIACRDVLAFREVDESFGRVAINLSAAQFNDANLLQDVQSVVEFWRVSPAAIEFEITESMVMHNRDQAIVLMDGLKAAGFTLSIDDFGTGYSSLAYLKRFPVDSVKIDRSFIKDIPEDPNDTAIVLAIVAMAHTLGLKVIAEGVETATQLHTLAASSCDEYQGFYFSKAVPEHEFVALLERQAETIAI